MLPVEVIDVKHIISFLLLFIFLFPTDKSLSICKILRKRDEMRRDAGFFRMLSTSWLCDLVRMLMEDSDMLPPSWRSQRSLSHTQVFLFFGFFFKEVCVKSKKVKGFEKEKGCFIAFEPFIFETLKSFWQQRDTFLFQSYEYLSVCLRLATLVADIPPSQQHKQN